MGNFSGEKAIASGFSLIFRNPAVIGVWAAFYLVLGLGPVLLFLGPLLNDQLAHASADPAAAFAAASRVMVWFPLLWLLSIAHASVAYGAVYRAVLRPDDRQYFYLRLSRRELWLGLTLLAILLLFMVFMVVVSITIGVLSRTAPGLVTFLAIIGALVGAVWLGMRVSMATPMAFSEQRFVLMNSWALTQGLGWKLFGVAVCLVAILFGIEIVLMIPVMLVLGMTGAFTTLMASAEAGHPGAYPLPVIVAYLVIFPLLAALMYAILGAPWANIYQQLTGPDADPVP